MLKLKVSALAEFDIDQGIRYYNRQQLGLGNRFLDAVKRTMRKIRKMPQSASFTYETVRYKVVEKFPFIILYEHDETQVQILRVFNTYLDDKDLKSI